MICSLKILVDRDLSLQTFYQDLNFRTIIRKSVKHRKISDRKIMLNNSVCKNLTCYHAGWLDRAIVLGIFQCRGVLLLWHIVGQGPAVLVAGAGQVGCFCFLFHLVYPIFLF